MSTKSKTKHDRRAERAINGLTAFGTSSHLNKGDGKIRCFNTANQYEGIYRRFSEWMEKEGISTPLNKATQEHVERYLEVRRHEIKDTNLANHRTALQIHLRNIHPKIHAKEPIELARFKSTVGEPKSAPRALNREQVKRCISGARTIQQKVAIAATYEGGLRTKELITLCPLHERPVTHREEDWLPAATSVSKETLPERFSGGREHWVRYSVIGKGKLPREVRLSPTTAKMVESLRFEKSIGRKDRGIGYEQRYDLAAGQALSESFREICIKANGFTPGVHGLRHSFAQERLQELMADGRTESEAKAILTQETGHWSESNLKYYMR